MSGTPCVVLCSSSFHQLWHKRRPGRADLLVSQTAARQRRPTRTMCQCYFDSPYLEKFMHTHKQSLRLFNWLVAGGQCDRDALTMLLPEDVPADFETGMPAPAETKPAASRIAPRAG